MHTLYLLSINAVPSNKPILFRQFLLVCHKSFLAAATLIGQAQPDDASPITRRAIEVVRLAAAVKADPAVLEEWYAYERRVERWKARNEGAKPKSVLPKLPPVKHHLLKQLTDMYGIISDTDAHFTPEHFELLRWEKQDDGILLKYFTGQQRTIELAIIHLLRAHIMMLQILDECLDGAFSSNPEWRELCYEIHAAAKPYAAKFEHRTGFDEPGGRSGG
jgi:hypothetical protein